MRNKLLVLSVMIAVGLMGCSNEEGDAVTPNIDQQQTAPATTSISVVPQAPVAPQVQQQELQPAQVQQAPVQPMVAPITGQPVEAAAPVANAQMPVAPIQEMQTALPVEQNTASPMPVAAPVQQSQLVEASGSAMPAPVAQPMVAQPATPVGNPQ